MTAWPNVRLDEICLKITDGSHNPPRGSPDGAFMMLSSKNVLDDLITLDAPRLLSESDFASENRRTQVQVGDVLLTIVGTVGRAAVVSQNLPAFTLQRSVAVLRPNPKMSNPRYLMYALQLSAPLLNEQAQGVAQKGIYLGALKNLEFPFPPLDEQRRIVAVLDKAFAGIATATANAQKNLTNARALFESHLQSIFADEHVGWSYKSFEACLQKIKYTQKIQRKDFKVTGEFPIVSQEAEFINGYWDREQDVLRVKSPLVIFGDHTQVLKYIDFDFVLGADGVKILLPIPALSAKFLLYFLMANPIKSIGYARHYRLLKEINVGFPALTEQAKITARLDELSQQIGQLEEVYQFKIAALTELKQSLLHKAFAGELT